MQWAVAQDWCQQRGMSLVTLETRSDARAVARELRQRGQSKKKPQISFLNFITYYTFAGYCWLSASDSGRTPGQFEWADRTPVDISMWYNGHHQEPNNFGAGRDTCVILDTHSAKLFDKDCSKTSRVLCDMPRALLACINWSPIFITAPLSLPMWSQFYNNYFIFGACFLCEIICEVYCGIKNKRLFLKMFFIYKCISENNLIFSFL